MAAGEGGGKFAAPGRSGHAHASGRPGPAGQPIFGSLAIVIATILLVGWTARRSCDRPRVGATPALRDRLRSPSATRSAWCCSRSTAARLVLGVGDGRVAILHRTAAMPTSATNAGPAGPGSNLPVTTASGERFVDLLRRSLGK
jgi:flagellar biogenesis protein FliO